MSTIVLSYVSSFSIFLFFLVMLFSSKDNNIQAFSLVGLVLTFLVGFVLFPLCITDQVKHVELSEGTYDRLEGKNTILFRLKDDPSVQTEIDSTFILKMKNNLKVQLVTNYNVFHSPIKSHFEFSSAEHK